MAINKNFVVKNGLEVNERLILANADTNRVGIGTSVPQYDLHVFGGIGVTHSYVTGISTVLNELRVGSGGSIFTVIAGPTGFGQSVGVGTADPNYLLEVRSPVSTGQTALYVYGDMRVTGDINLDDITLDDATIQNLTITENLDILVGGIATLGGPVNLSQTLDVVGITTLGDVVDINSTVDISDTLNVGGATTLGGYVDINNSVDIVDNLNVGGATTLGGYVDINNSVDIVDNLNVGGATTLGNVVDINSTVDISDTLNVGGATTLGGYVDINNSVDVSNDLNVVGLTTLGNVVDINSTVDISDTLNVGGATTLGGYVDINNSVDVSNDLNVVGLTTLGNVVDINSTVDILGTLNVGGATTLGGYVDINDSVDISEHLNVVGVSTLATVDINSGDIEVSNVDTADLNVTGISTLGTVQISSGIVTATSGIVTYYGDGQYLQNLPGGAGAPGGLDTQVQYNNAGSFAGSSNFVFDGESVTVGTAVTLNSTGINAPTGIITATSFRGGDLRGVNLNVTGVSTVGNVVIGSGATDFIVNGDARITGILTVGTSSLTLNGNTNQINGVTISSGIITASSFVKNGGTSSEFLKADGTVDSSTYLTSESDTLDSVTGRGNSTSNNISVGILTATDINSTSDASLKENVTTVSNALDTTQQLRGVRFEWKKDGKPSYGVIAQELEQILPELVSDTDPKTVNYNGIIGVLIEAVKELTQRVEDLENKS